jgi:hypothetical protein
LIGKQTESQVFDSIRISPKNGGCVDAVHQLNSVRIYEISRIVNYDCTISSDLNVEVQIPAGMATIVDTGPYRCTSSIS